MRTAIRRENAEIPGGRVEGEGREFAVRTRGELATAEEFASIIVRQSANDKVRLSDVADVEVGAENERTIARFNGRNAIGLGIVKQATASTIDVAEEIRTAIPILQEAVPPGMEINTAFDSSEFIKASIDEVQETILIAIVLVVLVVLVFLKSFRATVIPAVAIPISIIGTFGVIYFLGFTINILTLLAMVLSIGLVVDDAIVVLENVYRHMEMGKSRWRAAWDGSKEIGFAIVATTVALVAVFVPVAFLTGSVGKLFNEFGLTVAIAVAISGFVALSLTPMLCSRILKPLHGTSSNVLGRAFDKFFVWLDRFYSSVLGGVMRHRFVTVLAGIAIIVLSGFLFTRLPNELVPTEDRGWSFGVVIAPEGADARLYGSLSHRDRDEADGVARKAGVVYRSRTRIWWTRQCHEWFHLFKPCTESRTRQVSTGNR